MRLSPIPVVAQLTASIWRIIYSKWFGAMVVLCMVLGTILWFVTLDDLPRSIKIATGEKNGQYHLYGEVLADILEKRIDRKVDPLVTDGSVENQKRLGEEGEEGAHLAIIQNGAVSMAELTVIAPLYEDVVHVVVRKGRGIDSILDLSGKTVVLGKEGSGMRASAIDILNHYGLKPKELGDKTNLYFTEMEKDEALDAAIVTTGYVNSDLSRLLASGAFELLEIKDAEAISTHHAHFKPMTIPRGLYHEGPAVPDRPIKTVATTAILVAPSDVSEALVGEVVASLYEEYPHWEHRNSGRQLSRVMTASDARQWSKLPLHPVTQTYFEPYKGLVLLKDFMESIVATKDLMFALGAGIYFLWLWRRKVVSRKDQAERAIHMQKLNAWLDETIRIEKEQMKTDDPNRLRGYLEEVTQIKLHALGELTDEDVRGDQLFTIFLTQCSNLSRKLQLKIRLPVESQLMDTDTDFHTTSS